MTRNWSRIKVVFFFRISFQFFQEKYMIMMTKLPPSFEEIKDLVILYENLKLLTELLEYT